MSKIVSLIASPRKDGNTARIVAAMTDGAMGLSTNEICIHHLDNLRLVHGCRACNKCKISGKCVQNDDISPILEDIRTADIIIASTPLYFGHASSQYRMLEDRLYCFYGSDGRNILDSEKKVSVVVTCSGDVDDAKRCAADIEGVYKSLGFESLGNIIYSDNGGKNPVLKNSEIYKKAYAIGLLMRNI